MKSILTAAAVFALLSLGALALSSATARPSGEVNARFGEVEATRIVVRSRDGKSNITIAALEGGVGLWAGENARSVCIVANAGAQPYLGFNHPGMLDGRTTGCPLAFSVSEEGEPTVQVTSGKAVKIIDLADLLRLK